MAAVVSPPRMPADVEQPSLESSISSNSSSLFETGETLTAITSATSFLSTTSTLAKPGENVEEEAEAAEELAADIVPAPEDKPEEREPEPPTTEKGPNLPQKAVDIDTLSDAGGPVNTYDGDLYNPYDPPLYGTTLEARIEKAPKQLSQIFQYTKLMEERMQTLEREIKELKQANRSGEEEDALTTKTPADPLAVNPEAPASVQGTEISNEPEETTSSWQMPTLIPSIRKLAWNEWCHDNPTETHSIEILYGEPEDTMNVKMKGGYYDHNTEMDIRQRKADAAAKAEASAAPKEPPTSTGDSAPLAIELAPATPAVPVADKAFPKGSKEAAAATARVTSRDKTDRPTRIRIVSRLLRMELKSLTGFDIMRDSREFLEPFKPLIFYEKQIRENQAVLGQRLEQLRKDEAEMITRLEKEAADAAAAGKSTATGEAETTTEGKKPAADTTAPHNPEIDVTHVDGATEHVSKDASMNEELESLLLSPLPPVVFTSKVEDIVSEPNRSALEYGHLMVRFNMSKRQVKEHFTEYTNVEVAEETVRASRAETEETTTAWERRAKIYGTTVLIEEWKLLIQLFDDNLSGIIKIRNQGRNGELEEACFLDLCYFFQPGDFVMAHGDDRQLYQVFSSTGGRRLLDDKNLKISDMDEREAETTQEDRYTALGGLLHVTEQYSPLVVDCFHYDFNGIQIGAVHKSFTIKRYKGMEKLRQLAVYPGKFDPTEGEFGKIFTERGRKFMTLCAVNKTIVHKQYTGLSLDDPNEEVDSPVILDPEMASRIPEDLQPKPKGIGWVPKLGFQVTAPANDREIKEALSPTNCSGGACTTCPWIASPILNDHVRSQEYSKDFIASKSSVLTAQSIKEEDMEDRDYALLPCRVFGFVLRARKWARLDVANISDMETDEKNTGFDKLVLPPGYKEIVEALVETHFRRDARDAKEKEGSKKELKHHHVDLVRGKGKGLIILLHGAPGVGKTSTAECVAEHTGRPLFSITCGDIGEDPETVEKRLENCFQMAHKWGCVLLLDEADVFLARRSKTDLRRNALVSVFLRVLEYYAGILFLTTNRVGTFDEAFKSRIHMSLGYPPLDSKSTQQIWKMNLDRTQSFFKENLEIKDTEILQFAKKHFKRTVEDGGDASAWNGRQIRNAFQTAIALAQWEAEKENKPLPTLNHTHFKKVAIASTEFDKYLIEVYGGDNNADRALVDQERADNFIAPSPFSPSPPVRSSRPKPAQRQSSGAASRSSKAPRGSENKSSKTPSKVQASFGAASEEDLESPYGSGSDVSVGY